MWNEDSSHTKWGNVDREMCFPTHVPEFPTTKKLKVVK